MKIAHSPRSSAFTLIEMLVVIVLIAIIFVLLFSAYNSIQERICVAKCNSNVRQIVSAILQYSADNGGKLPAVWETPYTEESFWGNKLGVYLGNTQGKQRLGRDYLQCPTQHAANKSKNAGEKMTYGVLYTGNFISPPLFALRNESGRLANFRPSTMLVGEAEGMIYSPSVWRLDSDDGASSSKHKTPYNQALFPHDNRMTAGFADGSVRLITFEDWKNGVAELKLH